MLTYTYSQPRGHGAVFPLNERFYAAFYQALDILRVSINHSFPLETHPDRTVSSYGTAVHVSIIPKSRCIVSIFPATHRDAVGKIAVLSLLLHGRCFAYFLELYASTLRLSENQTSSVRWFRDQGDRIVL